MTRAHGTSLEGVPCRRRSIGGAGGDARAHRKSIERSWLEEFIEIDLRHVHLWHAAYHPPPGQDLFRRITRYPAYMHVAAARGMCGNTTLRMARQPVAGDRAGLQMEEGRFERSCRREEASLQLSGGCAGRRACEIREAGDFAWCMPIGDGMTHGCDPGGWTTAIRNARTLFVVGELSIECVYARERKQSSARGYCAAATRDWTVGGVGGRTGGVLPIGDRAPGRLEWQRRLAAGGQSCEKR